MNLRFEDAYISYLEYIEYRQKNQSKRTLKERFKNKILPFFKDYNIYEIKESDYLKWQNEIEIYNYSNNYKSNIHYLMTKFFDYLIKYYQVEKNIPRIVGNFKLKNEVKKYNIYTPNEFKRFIKCVDNNIYKQFFNLMFYTGTRPGEAMALRFSDLDKRILFINKTIDEHQEREIGSPKTTTSFRKIEIDFKLNRDLLKLKKYYIKTYDDKYFDYYANWKKTMARTVRRKNKFMRILYFNIPSTFLKIYIYFAEKKTYKDLNYDYYIFGGIKPLSPTTINRHKKEACIKAHLDPIKLHEFRHSHATMLVERKLMIKEISRRLGHSNANITLNTYTHAEKRHEKKVIKTLNFIRLF